MAGALPALEQVMCVERTGRGLDDDQGLRERLQVRGQAGGCGDGPRQPLWRWEAPPLRGLVSPSQGGRGRTGV